MNKIKLKVKQVNEVEYDLPYYCTNGLHFFKITSETKCVSINKNNLGAGIGAKICSHLFLLDIATDENNIIISEQQFKEAFETALVEIKQAIQ